MSDHALLRFLDRGGGGNVEAVRAALAESLARAARAAASIGQDDYEIHAGGLSYVVRDGVVVTIFHERPEGRRDAPRRR